MRILIFHGYLLRGTGSNVYNAELARALVELGHEVHLLCQERDPLALDVVDAAGTWSGGRLVIETRREPVRYTVYRPEIGDVLPVYVADRYDGFDARPFPELSDTELGHYLDANVAAVRAVAERVEPDVALANHLVMGPVILARALNGGVPYAVKIHGSALEYTVKPHPERFGPYGAEGLAGASAVLVGSRHTAESLWSAMAMEDLPRRTRLGPPGVDVRAFRPKDQAEAAAGVARLRTRLAERAAEAGQEPATTSAFSRDLGAAVAALDRLDPENDRLVAFVGKLIVSKGIDLLIAAWPLVLAEVPDARLIVVGFGAWRDAAERLIAALAAGDLAAAAAVAQAGRDAEGGAAAPLRHLSAFLQRLETDTGERTSYVAAAAALAHRVVLTGRLEHDELADLLPACEAMVVPSTFPEAFGMVAAEAAACGVLPICADHSGLAEVAATLRATVPPEAGELLGFPVGDQAVEAIAQRVVTWLRAPDDVRAKTREALAATARERYAWTGVARGVIAAAQGDLTALPPVR
jgi:glycosyltransferase involved in cell wall biosynthesis